MKLGTMKTNKVSNILIISLLIATTIVMTFCQRPDTKSSVEDYFTKSDVKLQSKVRFANGFDIYHHKGISRLVIYNPWNKGEVMKTYYFMDMDRKKEFQSKENILTYPIDSVAVFSATQLNAFSKLGLLDKVIAISESEYIQNKEVKNRADKGRIVNLASNGNFFLEKTLELNPEIIYYSPWNIAQKHPLAETQITMIPFFDFMEQDPLGRAEWIKFTALFFQREHEANSIFDTIVNKYNYYKDLASEVEERPTVFSDKYFNGQWFVPGGKSYISRLFSDSGADYLWKDNTNNASFNLDFEVVYNKAHNTDFWRIVGSYPDGFSYDNLGAENSLYQNFDAFKNHKVIFCDSKKTTYFETGTLEPHIVLGDLIYAFHPELLENYVPVYYRLIE